MNEEIMKFIASNNGMINTEEAKQNNISLKRLERLESDGELERIAQGLYLHKDFIVDPFYLAQYRSSKSIFSHSTALYLHKLSDENPSVITMTVPSDWNTQLLKEKDLYKFYYYKEELWKLGQEEIESPFGHQIKVYNKERTICDSVMSIDQIGKDIVLKAIKEYMNNIEELNIDRLYEYAEKFNIKDKLRIYVEAFYEIY